MKDRIKLIRKNVGDNQEQFAAKLGLSRNMVAQVETDKQKFSDRSIRDICRIYNVNEEWLRTGEGDMYAPQSRNEHIAEFLNTVMEDEPDSARKRWLEVLSNTDVEFWEMLDRMAREYVKKKED